MPKLKELFNIYKRAKVDSREERDALNEIKRIEKWMKEQGILKSPLKLPHKRKPYGYDQYDGALAFDNFVIYEWNFCPRCQICTLPLGIIPKGLITKEQCREYWPKDK